mgnify:CR=1 FL=1|tara:strand:+ start:1478 stop:1648 length:171 start_codon:yes stop_codon:yes gene_type:complete
MKTFSVVVTGFKSADEASEFVGWYSNSGEQDAGYHFEEHCPEVDPCGLKLTVEEEL